MAPSSKRGFYGPHLRDILGFVPSTLKPKKLFNSWLLLNRIWGSAPERFPNTNQEAYMTIYDLVRSCVSQLFLFALFGSCSISLSSPHPLLGAKNMFLPARAPTKSATHHNYSNYDESPAAGAPSYSRSDFAAFSSFASPPSQWGVSAERMLEGRKRHVQTVWWSKRQSHQGQQPQMLQMSSKAPRRIQKCPLNGPHDPPSYEPELSS